MCQISERAVFNTRSGRVSCATACVTPRSFRLQRAVPNNEVYQMKTTARVIVNPMKMNTVIPHQRHQHMLLMVLWRGRVLLANHSV